MSSKEAEAKRIKGRWRKIPSKYLRSYVLHRLSDQISAGTNVTLHKDARYKEVWREFKENSKLARHFSDMKSTYNESDNALISTARSISDRITGFFAENETAMVIKKFREMDPSFQLEPFLTEMRTYILPEVLEAYVKGDVETQIGRAHV